MTTGADEPRPKERKGLGHVNGEEILMDGGRHVPSVLDGDVLLLFQRQAPARRRAPAAVANARGERARRRTDRVYPHRHHRADVLPPEEG